MSEDIIVRHTLPMRGRPEVLYRLAFEPRRRVSWDPNLVKAEYVGDNKKLAQNALVEFKLSRGLLGLTFQAKYGQLVTSQRGSWESVKHVGPLEKLTQQWNFKNVPGGTEVTLTVLGRARYKWIRAQMERVLNNMAVSTLMSLQKQVDAPGAQLVEDLGREIAEKQKAEKKAAKGKKKA